MLATARRKTAANADGRFFAVCSRFAEQAEFLRLP
jgi:hypothetical protein